ncbi:hypothetical protein ERW54_11180 [Aliivibrio finisterrensis]|uniref:DUF5666 domain-containing protein n=1 Tax=Aliivibrio finisterrensis TaxID=511998 RepID=UPI001020EAAB|nr:DUF5666 domain-containing protein [Aliivibrio finisterrensis]RYU67687.1 hypothetical protein ERW54_11180 [Aliivibrio finisterrensis]RYU73979.1 hypothetical protein ERW48_11530 [Aliivibrio finisterrensis]
MKKVAVLLLGTVMLSGCGSDSSSDEKSVLPKSNVVEGVLQSINVNANEVMVDGINYHVSSIMFAGSQEVSLDVLKPNMMVRLSTNNEASTFSVNNATLTLEPTMVGVITDINRNVTPNTFKINGMALSANAELLNGAGNASCHIGDNCGIKDNDWVLISSLPTANVGYHVLSIVALDLGDRGYVEMEGMVNNLSPTTFELGANFMVAYDQSVIEDKRSLSNGQWIEVTGTMSNGVLTASEIEIEEYDDLDENTDIEGIISWVEKDKSSFELNYKGRFVVKNNTIYDDGAQGDLIVGKHVEVTAKMVNGINQVFEIEFEDADNDWLEPEGRDLNGKIVAIDLNATSPFFVIQTIREDKTVFLTTRTEFDDYLTADTLSVGMMIEVETYLVNGQYMAIEIELNEDDND